MILIALFMCLFFVKTLPSPLQIIMPLNTVNRNNGSAGFYYIGGIYDGYVRIPSDKLPVGGKGVAMYIGTTSPTFAVNYNEPRGNSDGCGFIVIQGQGNIVGGIVITPHKNGWLFIAPNKNSSSPDCPLSFPQGNIFLGHRAGWRPANHPVTFASNNVGVGISALQNLVNVADNSYNVSCGYCAGANLQGNSNISIGNGALLGKASPGTHYDYNGQNANGFSSEFISGNNNIACGTLALARLVGTSLIAKNDQNICIGMYSGYGLHSGTSNIVIGAQALTQAFHNNYITSAVTIPTTQNIEQNPASFDCNYNIAIGFQAMQRSTSDPFVGNFNIAIGTQAGSNIGPNTNGCIFIGMPGSNLSPNNTTYIANVYGHSMDPNLYNGIPQSVYVNKNGELGFLNINACNPGIAQRQVTSGVGTPIQAINPNSDFEAALSELFNLQIMSYQYLGDTKNQPRFGFPGDLSVKNPDINILSQLIVYDQKSGEVVSLEQGPLVPLLVSWTQSASTIIQTLRDKVACLEAQVAALCAGSPCPACP